MGVYRIKTTQDCSITDSYVIGTDISSRSSNSGNSDSLEVFSAYNRKDSMEHELSRILIKFDIEDLRQKISDGVVTGSPSYFLKLYDVAHHLTLPDDFTLEVYRVTSEWNEGSGVDLDNYTDKDVANWTHRTYNPNEATGTITVDSNPPAPFMVAVMSRRLTITPGASPSDTASAIASAINLDTNINYYVTASASSNVVTLTANFPGVSGNSIKFSSNSADLTSSGPSLAGGADFTEWSSEGGDFDGTAVGSVYFKEGWEDLELDVTSLVEGWLDNSYDDHGIIIKFPDVDEQITKRPLFTKRFSARSSEYFLKRPVIEVRWDNSQLDDTSRFRKRMDFLPATHAKNINNLFLELKVDGVLYDIDEDDSLLPDVKFYSDADMTSEIIPDSLTISRVSQGLYKAEVSIDTAETEFYVLWHRDGDTDSVFLSETILPMTEVEAADSEYLINIVNLKNKYYNNEIPVFEVFTRLRNWSPNAYVKYVRNSYLNIPNNLHFSIRRVEDDLNVIDYDISNNSTRVSRGIRKSYFKLDTSMLESGFMYEIRFARVLDNSTLIELKETFKFRVEPYDREEII